MKSQKTYTPRFSFEFFPPRNPEAVGKLQTTQQRLAKLSPDFFSVTYGAGGSTREMTLEATISIRDNTGVESVPHISCIGSSIEEILAVLQRYKAEGFRHIVALRGDLPSGAASMGPLRYANELVEFIRKDMADDFCIDVACYPEFQAQARCRSQ